MQISNAPPKISLPFANSGNKNVIPVPASATPGAASYSAGFPPETRISVPSGGTPPSGLDFNGIFYSISALARWYASGAGFPFDSTFATAIGGYPSGARVVRADGIGYWRNVVDNNVSNPDTGGAGWATDGVTAIASVYASSTQTLAQGGPKVLFDTVDFDSRGLWDTVNKRFSAMYAGLYRLSGSIYLQSPVAQNYLRSELWVNGAPANPCFVTAQISDGDISLPFTKILNLGVGSFVEVHAGIGQSSVTAAGFFTYAQMEYLGAV